MTQVQTIGGLKRGRGRGRGRSTGRGRGGRGGRSDKPATFEPFKGSANSLTAHGNQQHPVASHGSGVFADEHQHLAGVAKLQQQHDEAIALRAVQMAELEKQRQIPVQASSSGLFQAPATSASAAHQFPSTSSAAGSSIIDLCNDDDTGQPAQQASTASRPPAKPREQISWSLGVDHPISDSSVPSGSSNTDNPFWCPARYMPVGGEAQADLCLQTHEVVQVLDSGLVGHRGTAILDTGISFTICTASSCNSADATVTFVHAMCLESVKTLHVEMAAKCLRVSSLLQYNACPLYLRKTFFAGNAGCTLITRSFARQLGLIDMHGNPTQAYSRTIRVQGVVAGAFEMIKTLNITYELKGALIFASSCCPHTVAKPLLAFETQSLIRLQKQSELNVSLCRQKDAHYGRPD